MRDERCVLCVVSDMPACLCLPCSQALCIDVPNCAPDGMNINKCLGCDTCIAGYQLSADKRTCSCPAGQTYCPAESACREPAASKAEGATCCPTDTPWTVDECAGAMTCSATTKTCQCPNAGEKWCSAANSGTGGCVAVSPTNKLGDGSVCCFATQCSSGACVGNKCTACPTGETASWQASWGVVCPVLFLALFEAAAPAAAPQGKPTALRRAHAGCRSPPRPRAPPAAPRIHRGPWMSALVL